MGFYLIRFSNQFISTAIHARRIKMFHDVSFNVNKRGYEWKLSDSCHMTILILRNWLEALLSWMRYSGPVYTGPDKFLHGRILVPAWTACLHGSVQILLQWCLHGSVQSLDQLRHLIPGHNRAIWAKSCTFREFTRVRTNIEPCRSKSWPAFFRSQTCTLSRSKIRPVPPVPCKRKVELCKFLSAQRFVRTRVNRASDRYRQRAYPFEGTIRTIQMDFNSF